MVSRRVRVEVRQERVWAGRPGWGWKREAQRGAVLERTPAGRRPSAVLVGRRRRSSLKANIIRQPVSGGSFSTNHKSQWTTYGFRPTSCCIDHTRPVSPWSRERKGCTQRGRGRTHSTNVMPHVNRKGRMAMFDRLTSDATAVRPSRAMELAVSNPNPNLCVRTRRGEKREVGGGDQIDCRVVSSLPRRSERTYRTPTGYICTRTAKVGPSSVIVRATAVQKWRGSAHLPRPVNNPEHTSKEAKHRPTALDRD